MWRFFFFSFDKKQQKTTLTFILGAEEEFGVKNYVKMLAGVHNIETWRDVLGAEGVIIHSIIQVHIF